MRVSSELYGSVKHSEMKVRYFIQTVKSIFPFWLSAKWFVFASTTADKIVETLRKEKLDIFMHGRSTLFGSPTNLVLRLLSQTFTNFTQRFEKRFFHNGLMRLIFSSVILTVRPFWGCCEALGEWCDISVAVGWNI